MRIDKDRIVDMYLSAENGETLYQMLVDYLAELEPDTCTCKEPEEIVQKNHCDICGKLLPKKEGGDNLTPPLKVPSEFPYNNPFVGKSVTDIEIIDKINEIIKCLKEKGE